MSASERMKSVGFSIALCLIVMAAYWPGLSGSFMFDDRSNIVDNATLRLFDGSFSSLITASQGGTSSPLGRPLSMASFALNLHFLANDPFYFKLVNLLIHLMNGVLVFLLAKQLWPRLAGTNISLVAPMWIATVWMLHPLNLTPVLFVVQRMTGLAALFTLSALSLYFYGRRKTGSKAWIAITVSLLLCWPAAVLSKETGLLLPLFLLLCEWFALGGFHSISARMRWLIALSAGLTAFLLLIIKWDLLFGSYRFRDFDAIERLLTESRVLWFYLQQLLLPWPDVFALFHDDIPISRGLFFPPETLFSIVGWGILIGLAIYRRKQTPALTFAVGWFLAGHALESTFLPLEIAYEHRNYLASIGVLIWLASLLFPNDAQGRGKVPRFAIASCFAIFCGFTTTLRAAQWGDEYRRTQIEATIRPDSARANYEAALAIMQRTFYVGGGNAFAYKMAHSHFKRAAELDRFGKAPLIGLLYLDCLAGSSKDLNVLATLRERFAHSPLLPGDRAVIQSMSSLLVEERLCLNEVEVKALLDAALSNPTADGRLRGMLNVVAMDYAAAKIGSVPLALTYAKAAVDSDPVSASLRMNVINLLLALGDEEAARREYAALASLHIAPRDKADVEQLDQQMRNLKRNANTH